MTSLQALITLAEWVTPREVAQMCGLSTRVVLRQLRRVTANTRLVETKCVSRRHYFRGRWWLHYAKPYIDLHKTPCTRAN